MRGPRAQRCHQMVRGVAGAIGHWKLYGKELKCRLMTENTDTAAMYKAINSEVWFSSHWFLTQWPALA